MVRIRYHTGFTGVNTLHMCSLEQDTNWRFQHRSVEDRKFGFCMTSVSFVSNLSYQWSYTPTCRNKLKTQDLKVLHSDTNIFTALPLFWIEGTGLVNKVWLKQKLWQLCAINEDFSNILIFTFSLLHFKQNIHTRWLSVVCKSYLVCPHMALVVWQKQSWQWLWWCLAFWPLVWSPQ